MSRISILNYLLKFATNAVLTVQAVQGIINSNKNKLLENINIVVEFDNYRQEIYVENKGVNISNVRCEETLPISLIIKNSNNINISNTNLDIFVTGSSSNIIVDSIIKIKFSEANVSKANISKAGAIILQQSDIANCSFENLNSDAIVFIKGQSKLSISKINVYELSINDSAIFSSKISSYSSEFYRSNFFECNIPNIGIKRIESCIFSNCKVWIGLNDEISNVKFDDCYVFINNSENPNEQFSQSSFLHSKIYCNFSNFIYFVDRNKYEVVDISSFKIGGNTIRLNEPSGAFKNPFKNFVYIDDSNNYYIFTSESEQDVININNEFADINGKKLKIANPDYYPKDIQILLQDYKLITYNSLVFDF